MPRYCLKDTTIYEDRVHFCNFGRAVTSREYRNFGRGARGYIITEDGS